MYSETSSVASVLTADQSMASSRAFMAGMMGGRRQRINAPVDYGGNGRTIAQRASFSRAGERS
jgi:hypothetical protein